MFIIYHLNLDYSLNKPKKGKTIFLMKNDWQIKQYIIKKAKRIYSLKHGQMSFLSHFRFLKKSFFYIL